MPAPPYEHRLRVRYAETDQMGVAYHGSHLVWMDEARTRYLAALGVSYAELERRGIGLAVRRVEVAYRASARFDEELVVRVWVERAGRASASFAYEMDRPADGERVAEARVELACLDLAGPERRVRPLPPEVAAALAG